MNKLGSLLAMIALSGIIIIGGCNKDEDDDTNNNNNPPSQNLNPEFKFKKSPMFAAMGETMMFEIEVSSISSTITSFKVEAMEIDSATGTVKAIPAYNFDSTLSGNKSKVTINWSMYFLKNEWNSFDTVRLKFIAVDKNSRKTSKIKNVAVGKRFTDLVYGPLWPAQTDNTPWKLQHQQTGADFRFCLDEHDLRTNVIFGYLDGEAPVDAIDFMDNSPTGSSVNGSWKVGPGNETTLAIAPAEFDWQTSSNVEAAYYHKIGNPTKTLDGIQTGDVVIARIRGTLEYAAMNIVDVTDDAKDNEGYVAFRIKCMYDK